MFPVRGSAYGARLNDRVGVADVATAARAAPRRSDPAPRAADVLLDALVALADDYDAAVPRCREALDKLARPRLARVHALLERRGFAAILAARLMPGVPAGGLHYAAGASPVRLGSFAGAMAIGALLRTVPYALLGNGLGSGSTLALLIAGASIAVSAVTAAVLVRRLRRPAVAAAGG